MFRHTALTVGLALALTGVGTRADDATGRYNGASSETIRPLQNLTPIADVAEPADPNGITPEIREDFEAPEQMDAADVEVQQNDQQPGAAAPPESTRTDTGAMGAETHGMMGLQPLWPTDRIHTPLQGFVSTQVHEVGMLAQQIDFFKAAGRPDVVQTLYHMVRDHVLVSDAGQNVLARRGDISKPVSLMAPEPMPNTAEEIIRHDIAMHEKSLERTRELLANATSPEERSVYQTAERATQKHLEWLRRLDQGERVALGFFGPTIPLSQIAGYRAEIGTRSNRSRTTRRMRSTRRGR
jgi:hypothetical protein